MDPFSNFQYEIREWAETVLSYLIFNIPLFLAAFFYFRKKKPSAMYIALGYLATSIIVCMVFFVGGRQWGIGQSKWFNPQLARCFVFVTFVAVNLLYWRFLFKLTTLKAYLFSIALSVLNTVICFLGMPLVR